MTQNDTLTISADPQSENDTRGIALNTVGINKVKYPVLISGWKPNTEKEVDGLFSLQVSLASDKRGIHMSRLLEHLHHWETPLSPTTLSAFLTKMREEQGAEFASMSCQFTWYVNRPTPETGRNAWQGIETTWQASQNTSSNTTGYTLRIPVTTLCPCSRDISDYGAHSQRGWITVQLEWSEGEKVVSPEEIYNKLESAGSAPIYPLLKRADERHVTMKAYDNPAFVEDTIRQAAEILQSDPRIKRFQLDVCNEESIHTHDAVASLSIS